MLSLKQLVREIHRRSIWQVLAIYGVASWGVLGVVGTLVDTFELPTWLPRFALALVVAGSTRSLEAYELYRRGRLSLKDRTGEAIWRAFEDFTQAVRLDSTYALAYSGLSDALTLGWSTAAGWAIAPWSAGSRWRVARSH